jgi:serine/threonine protein kinase
MPALRPGDPTKLGDWTLTRRIAEGGAGNIFQGVRGIDDSENAAIKVLKDEAFDIIATQEYLKREVAALKLIDHENVVKFIEVNFESGEMWLATEYVFGPNLETYLKQNPDGVKEHRWFQIAENIFSGLVAVHSHNIIHRDISPKNIMLSEQTRAAKIIDFGISYVPTFTASSTRDNFEGSRLFAAPENISLKDDPKMDVFSAAVTLAYIGKGSSIWQGQTTGEITNSIIKGVPNLEGLTKNQQNFLKPLLAKFTSERSSSQEAHKKSLEFLEYIVDAENVKKPKNSNIKKILVRRLRKRSVKYGLLPSLVAFIAVLSISPWTAKNVNPLVVPAQTSSSLGLNAKSDVLPAPSSNVQNDVKQNLSPEIAKAAADCTTLSNSFNISLANKSCLIAANAGDAASMNSLGYNFYVTLKDTKQGIFWYTKAAEAGSAIAMFNLGTAYTESDPKKAENWFRKCVESDFASCAYNYGIFLQKYNRIAEAKIVYQKGVDLGNDGSANNLGVIYYDEKNWAKAKEMFSIGGKSGNYLSAFSLGEVLQYQYSDRDQACVWYYKALNLKPDYIKARTAVIETCKNRKFEISPDVQISNATIAPYQNTKTASDRKAGDWVVWLKSDDFDASTASGIQYRISGTNDPWKYVFYGTYSNAAGVYSYINERPGLEGACLDFRLVRESKDGNIVQIWNLPPSICKKI